MLPWTWLARKSKSSRHTCSQPQGSCSLFPIAWSSSRSSGSEQTATCLVSKPGSQVSSIFHFFFVLFQKVAVDEDGKKCWGIVQIVFHPTLKITSKAPAHQNSVFSAGKWLSKLYSMSPLLWDLKVIVAGTSKLIF